MADEIQPTPEMGEDAAEAALIDQYTRETDIPSPLAKWYRLFKRDRDYVNNDCMMTDANDAVGTNHILRNQYSLMAQLVSRKADIRCEVRDMVWPPVPQYVTDPMTGQPIVDPMTGQPATMGELPGEPPPEITMIARTGQVLGQRLLDEARWYPRLRGAIQDVETNAIIFIKVNQQEELTKDPLGKSRFNDTQDNYALYRHWAARVAEGDIAEDSAEMARFRSLEQTVRQYLAAQIQDQITQEPFIPPMDPVTGIPVGDPMTGLPMADPREAQVQGLLTGTEPIDMSMVPEVPHYIGFPIDFVNPEDIRISGDIVKPEDLWDANRIQHRVTMMRDAAAAKYGLTSEEARMLPNAEGSQNRMSSSSTGNGTGEDVTARDNELTDDKMDQWVDLWECWDRQLNYVCVYARGFKRFFHKYTPTIVWRRWFPFFPFQFNRTTGRLVGVSSTTLQRPSQEEINQLRSLDRHAKKAGFPRILAMKGVFSPGERARYKRSLPYEVIELENPSALNDAIKETAVVPYNPQLTDSSRAEVDLQRMAGISLVAGGAVGVSNSATETATAQVAVDAMIEYRRGVIEELTEDVVTCLLDLAFTALPEENIKALAGPGAFVPQVDRETLWRALAIKVRAGSMGKPDTDKKIAWATNMIQISRNLGLVAKGPQVLDMISREMGQFDGLSQYFEVAPMMGAPGMPGPGGPPPATGGFPPSPPSPESQQGQGGGGGQPMNKAPSPQSIPNRPQVG